ncbi:FimV/HubP family polar landmark protein [Kaarinaea lacus]
MGKLFARAMCSVLLFVPAISFALGLGPITMRSSLNQPLDAEIDIHSAQPGDLDGFAVRLASVEDFARVNVDRSVFLTQIQFKLRLRSDGSSYIHLTTTQRVTEPYLDFLIEARWPRGRALKEYTVLVDPPVLTAETPAPVEQASTAPVFAEPAKPKARRPSIRPVEPRVEEPVRQQPQIAKRPPAPPPVRRAPPAPREEAVPEGDIDYGRVKRGDTLYEIARDTKAAGVSINQMMLAYLRDNPEAFIDGNINKLKAGYVLRIKDASTIADTSSQEAVSEVRRQNLAWREGRPTRLVKQVESEGEGDSRLSSLRDELDDASPESKPAKSAASESGQKADGPKVVLAKKDSEAKEGSAGSSDKQDDEAGKVKEDLLLAAESLDATNQETKLLDERMVELDEQLQSMQRLIMLKDEELLSLQNMKAEGKVDEAVDKAKQDAQKQAAATPPKAEPKKEESLIPEELLSDPILLGLAGLLVVAVVGWLVVRRRRMHGGFEESILNVGAGGGAAAADEGGPESAMVSDFVMSDMPSAQVDASEVDAISEADVYLAYGRHQQAEDILRQALDKTPDQLDLHAKMLEVYHAAKNADAFEAQARMLHEKIGGDTSNSYWSDIEPLGREICPHSELFGGGGGAPDLDMGDDDLGGMDMSAEEEDLLDFDFNEDSGVDELSAAADSDSSDDSLDFDMSSLDFDMDSSSDTATAQPEVSMEAESAIEIPDEPAAEEDSGLDFDLSFGDDDTQSESEESVIGMEMDTSTEMEADNSLDFDSSGFDMEADDAVAVEEEAPLDLSMDMEEDDSTGGLSLEMDQGADIVQLDTGSDEIDLDGELDEDIFSNVDEVGTKLDLAKAYVDMGDSDGARSILDEVLEEGDDSQKQQAEELLQQMG